MSDSDFECLKELITDASRGEGHGDPEDVRAGVAVTALLSYCGTEGSVRTTGRFLTCTTPPGLTPIIMQMPRNAESFSSLSRMFLNDVHLGREEREGSATGRPCWTDKLVKTDQWNETWKFCHLDRKSDFSVQGLVDVKCACVSDNVCVCGCMQKEWTHHGLINCCSCGATSCGHT